MPLMILFMMILIRIELVWNKNEWFIFIKFMFCFFFLHNLEKYSSWILLYCMLSIPKGQKEKVNFLMVWYHIISYRYRFVSIGIVTNYPIFNRQDLRYWLLHTAFWTVLVMWYLYCYILLWCVLPRFLGDTHLHDI